MRNQHWWDNASPISGSAGIRKRGSVVLPEENIQSRALGVTELKRALKRPPEATKSGAPEKQAEANSVSVRSRARGDEGVMTADAYVAKLKTEVATGALPQKAATAVSNGAKPTG